MDFLSLTWWRKIYAKGGRVFAIGCALVFVIPIILTAGFNIKHGPSGADIQQGGTLASVNGEPITSRDLSWVPSESLGGTPGRGHAGMYGQTIFSLVQHKVIEQIAKKENVHPTDAEIDRAIAKVREKEVGAKATDIEWENYLSERHHVAASDFREYMASQVTVEALVEHYKAAENVTAADAQKLNSEVKLTTVFIASKATGSPFPPSPKSLPEAEAEKKANDLHAKAVTGADLVAIAKANSADFQATSKTPGVSDWQKEYVDNQFGAFMYGKDVDEAVQKTAVGQISPVVKATGFRTGFFFAKVVERRLNTPKDFDEKKEIASLKEQRAYKKLDAIIKAAVKSAKVVFSAEQIDKKAYYDYAHLMMMQQEMGGMMGMSPSSDAPTQADMDKQQAEVDADFEALLKKTPEDTTATLMVAASVQTKMATAPPTQQPVLRDRLISLYESAFKSTEDINSRFTLAGLYVDKKDYKSAFTQYSKIAKLLDDDPPYDLNSREKQRPIRERVVTALKGFSPTDVPEAAAAVKDQETKLADLVTKLTEDKAKQIEERKKTDELQKQLQKATSAPAVPSKTPPPAGGPTPAPQKPAKASN